MLSSTETTPSACSLTTLTTGSPSHRGPLPAPPTTSQQRVRTAGRASRPDGWSTLERRLCVHEWVLQCQAGRAGGRFNPQEVIDTADGTGNLEESSRRRSARTESKTTSRTTGPYARRTSSANSPQTLKGQGHLRRTPQRRATVHSPETEVMATCVCNDFLAPLDPPDRRIVVLLSSDVTKFSTLLPRSAIPTTARRSKRLAKIRKLAERHLVSTGSEKHRDRSVFGIMRSGQPGTALGGELETSARSAFYNGRASPARRARGAPADLVGHQQPWPRSR